MILIDELFKQDETTTSFGVSKWCRINRNLLESCFHPIKPLHRDQWAVQFLKSNLLCSTTYVLGVSVANDKAEWYCNHAGRLGIIFVRTVSYSGKAFIKFFTSHCSLSDDTRRECERNLSSLAILQLRSAKLSSLRTGNTGCIFELEDLNDGEHFFVYLRRFSQDASPLLPRYCDSISTDSPLGLSLMKCERRVGEVVCCEMLRYKICFAELYNHPVNNISRKGNAPTRIAEELDHTKHADGHFARESTGWGSFPKHDQYGDESTGEERDYEEYPEYVAHYGD